MRTVNSLVKDLVHLLLIGFTFAWLTFIIYLVYKDWLDVIELPLGELAGLIAVAVLPLGLFWVIVAQNQIREMQRSLNELKARKINISAN